MAKNNLLPGLEDAEIFNAIDKYFELHPNDIKIKKGTVLTVNGQLTVLPHSFLKVRERRIVHQSSSD